MQDITPGSKITDGEANKVESMVYSDGRGRSGGPQTKWANVLKIHAGPRRIEWRGRCKRGLCPKMGKLALGK